MNNQQRIKIITERLQQAFQPTELKIIDDSSKHIGHAGAKSGGGHFCVIINAEHFNNLTKIASHRLIHAELKDLFATEIHALSIKINS
jgi:BolA family transcriptional regulator, general stress-responsive regulator